MHTISSGLLVLVVCASAVSAQSEERTDVEQVQDVVQRFYTAWNQQDFVAAEDLVAHSVIEFDMRDRADPQTWVLRKLQTRDEYLDHIVGEWTGGDGRWYDADTHKYIKEFEFFDTYLWDDLAMAIVGERRVGLDGPADAWSYNAWLLNRADGGWKIAGTLSRIAVDYEPVQVAPRDDHVRIRIFIDGYDEVFIDDEGVWIEHHNAALPGRHKDGDGFSPVHVNGVEWQPIWLGDKTRKVLFDKPFELPTDKRYHIVKHRARDIVQVEAEPQQPGDPVSVYFADEESGADWYDVELRWSDEPHATELPAPSPPGRDDLLIEVLFDGEIRDTSPDQRPLTNTQVVLTTDRDGNEDAAGYFNGEAVVDIPGFPIEGPFSVSIWVKYDEIEKRSWWWNNCIWAQDGDGSKRVWQLSTLGRRATWHRMQDEDLHSKMLVQKDRWYHLAAVYDGDYHRLFVDGVFQDNKQSTVELTPDQPIYIGAKHLNAKDFFFTGALDDARLYDRVLTEAEISALYQGLAE